MEDRCVCCGAVIPEGRQVCLICDKKICGNETGGLTRPNTREKLIEIINNFFGVDAAYFGVNPLDFAIHLIANGVEIPVRCKDCDFAYEGSYGLMCAAWNARTDYDMFCGNGERKDNEKQTD